MKPRVLIIRAPGTNCDLETKYAFELAGASAEVHHVNRWLENPSLSEEYQILCIPGGFSFGDDVAAGRILANQMHQFLGEQVTKFINDDKLILGICNGFQALLKCGILLPEIEERPAATLTWNDAGHFIDRWVYLEVKSDRCVFLRDVQSMYLPIAHAEGKFVADQDSLLDQWEANGQLVIGYCEGVASSHRSPANPNGSQRNVAGVCDTTGRVFGLMPHPERFVQRTQHPQWTRHGDDLVVDGLAVFNNAVGYFD
jgi:phosphoribosylformylglycinamidine synthase